LDKIFYVTDNRDMWQQLLQCVWARS